MALDPHAHRAAVGHSFALEADRDRLLERVSEAVIVLALIQESKTHAEAKGLAEDACTTGRVFDLIRQAPNPTKESNRG